MRLRPTPILNESSELFSSRKTRGGLSLQSILARGLLVNSESHSPLRLDESERYLIDEAGLHFELDDVGRPNLLPLALQSSASEPPNRALQLYWSLNQYRLGEGNSAQTSIPWRLHARRFQDFAKDVEGLTLDVGADLPSVSIQLMNNKCDYIPLEPFASSHNEFCVVGMAEMLPFADSCLDAVVFNTSLDHVLDWRTAIEEAHRVLKANGKVVVATLAWLGKATLLTDDIHFHHFREPEMLDELGVGFTVDRICRYPDPTNRAHRFGLYVQATKCP